MSDDLPPRLVIAAASVMALAATLELLLLHRRGTAIDWRENAASLLIATGFRLITYSGSAAALAIFLWIWRYRLYTVPMERWWSAPLLFIGVEFFYYWQHRVFHSCRWFWASHAVHHSARQMNMLAAYRLSWTAGISGSALLYAPLVLLGFHPLVVLLVFALNLMYQFWLHTDLVPRLGWYDHVFNSPANHRVHHAINDGYLEPGSNGVNYGGVLIVFDRLFGTWRPERADLPCEYGLRPQVGSSNPLRIMFYEWLHLLGDLRHAHSWRAVLGHLFGPPGWRPEPSAGASSAVAPQYIQPAE